jgi:hypothetical protein
MKTRHLRRCKLKRWPFQLSNEIEGSRVFTPISFDSLAEQKRIGIKMILFEDKFLLKLF